MYSLLVLGIIPGTDIQITFAGWLCLFAVVIGVWFKNTFRVSFESQTAANTVRGLHASQLHRRGV